MATTQTRAAGADDPSVPEGLLDHLAGLQAGWDGPGGLRSLITPWHPRNEGEGEGGEGDGAGDGQDGDGAGDEDGAGAGDGTGDGDTDWKQHSRKHERDAKKARKEADELRRQLQERTDGDKTEQERAIEQARKEARTEALSEAEKDRRTDRLESAVIKAAAKEIKVGDAAFRFADIDDAQVYVDRAIARGDIDNDDIFDSEGKVQTDALTSALAEILEKKPHLRAGTTGAERGSGGSDAGRGGGDGGVNDDTSVEGQLKAIKRT